jgi:hypothetical protein
MYGSGQPYLYGCIQSIFPANYHYNIYYVCIHIYVWLWSTLYKINTSTTFQRWSSVWRWMFFCWSARPLELMKRSTKGLCCCWIWKSPILAQYGVAGPPPPANTHTHTYTHIHKHTHTYTHTHVHTLKHMRTQTHTHTYFWFAQAVSSRDLLFECNSWREVASLLAESQDKWVPLNECAAVCDDELRPAVWVQQLEGGGIITGWVTKQVSSSIYLL